jgi:hypothetical protein
MKQIPDLYLSLSQNFAGPIYNQLSLDWKIRDRVIEPMIIEKLDPLIEARIQA